MNSLFKKPNAPYYFIFIVTLLYVTWTGFSIYHANGIVECTKKNGYGCICHGNNQPSDSVSVIVIGPDTLRVGETGIYTVMMSGGPAVKGGFNVACGSGSLLPYDSTAVLLHGELTHFAPLEFSNDLVSWFFYYTAPASSRKDTIFSAGNSVNDNGSPSGDEYNFGEDFIVNIVDTTTTVFEEGLQPVSYSLYQNYPNPFNPTTGFRFEIPVVSDVILNIYNVLGKEIQTLVNTRLNPGTYNVEWNAVDMAGGIYFSKFRAHPISKNKVEDFIQTKKIILAK